MPDDEFMEWDEADHLLADLEGIASVEEGRRLCTAEREARRQAVEAGGGDELFPSIEVVTARVLQTSFGRPLVTNVLRSMLVEAMVDQAINWNWRWCAQDYASWDFEHRDGMRLEVKQSAARQSWARAGDKASSCSWDIAPRKRFWDQGQELWVAKPGRNADIYILAYHPVIDEDADHRTARQWLFFVIEARKLPKTRRLSLPAAQKLTAPIPFYELTDKVERVRRICQQWDERDGSTAGS